jgi:hypothetical protein
MIISPWAQTMLGTNIVVLLLSLGLPPSLPGGLSLGAVLLSSAALQGFRSVLMQRNGYFS